MDNPINLVDPEGQMPLPIITGAFGALTGFGGNIIGQLISNGVNFDCINWKDAFIAAGVGAVAGAITPYVATTYFGAASLGASANTVQYGITQYANGNSITSSGVGWSIVTGSIGGLAGGRIRKAALPYDESSLWMDSKVLRLLRQDAQAAVNTGLGSFMRNLGGATTTNIDPFGSGSSSCECP
jgi:hypothetical protein